MIRSGGSDKLHQEAQRKNEKTNSPFSKRSFDR